MSVEGSGDANPIKQQQYVQEAQLNIQKFEQNLIAYQTEQNKDMKINNQEVMNSSMELIQGALSEIKRSGIQKQGSQVQSDFKEFMQTNSDESLTKLNQDMATLKQYLAETGS